jgi:hypothetical protein
MLLALCLVTTACSDESCYENGSSLPLATLCLGEAQQTISGLTVMGIGSPGDSLLLNNGAVKELYLPLRASVQSTAFMFGRWLVNGTDTVTVRDTVTFDYQPVEYFHSAECGAMFNFNLKNVRHTTHGIDSVVLLTDVVTNSQLPSIRIHFTDFAL